MSSDLRKMRKEERLREKHLRKDRLIQTRVDRRLQKVLVDTARQRRISVSNLVRNVLEDAFGLAEPDTVVEPTTPPPSVEGSNLEHVYAWNSVTLGRDAECSRCAREMNTGGRAFIGMSEDPTTDRAWLCLECGEDL